MGKFWVIIYKEKLVLHNIFHHPWQCLSKRISPVYTTGGAYGRPAYFTAYKDAEKAASEITKKYGGDVYIMEAVALATVPTTIVKIEE